MFQQFRTFFFFNLFFKGREIYKVKKKLLILDRTKQLTQTKVGTVNIWEIVTVYDCAYLAKGPSNVGVNLRHNKPENFI